MGHPERLTVSAPAALHQSKRNREFAFEVGAVPIPELGTALLMCLGLAGLALQRRWHMAGEASPG